LNRTRKKLIEELIRVGRLIDPAPGSRQRKAADDAELPGITEQSGIDNQWPMADLEDLPIVNDIVDRPYTTKDMFAAPTGNYQSKLPEPSRRQQPPMKISDSSNTPITKRTGLPTTNLEKQAGQEANAISFPVDELARELVTLIEDRVSQRSGEQLDDTFRDELTLAVIARLEGWLK
jgi:hypothetical protein